MQKNYYKVSIVLITLCIWTNIQLSAQFRLFPKLGVEVTNATLSSEDTTIVITYDLRGFKRRYYNTKLYYSNNKGNSFKGPLRTVEGDLGDSVKIGKGKKVAWKFFRDNPYFDGKNIQFKVEATEVPKISNGGPINALRSVFVPGLGDTKVRNGYNYAWITAVSYGFLGTGLGLQLRSNKKYNDYKNRVANTLEEHNNLLDEAKNAQNIATGFFIAGATVWIADIVGVYLRGKKNKRRIEAEQEELEEDEEEAFDWKPSIVPNIDNGINQISLIWKF